MKNRSRMFAGILLVLVGLAFFLKMLGILNFSIWSGFKYYWPVGLILVGTALIFRMKWLAVSFLFLTVLFGALYVGSEVSAAEVRTITKTLPADSISTADINVAYGAGTLRITDGNNDTIVKHIAKTADINDPEIDVKKTGSNAEINIERKTSSFRFWNKDDWEIELSPGVEFNLDLDYGAADSKINLENLKVNNLDMDTGATSTEITFGSYPTKVDIATGASSIILKFPKDMGIKIEVDGGAVSANLRDFTKKDSIYYSENYDPKGKNIEIAVDAGATSVDGSFY